MQPVIMLTALGNTDDVILGFDSGADDYLKKPLSFANYWYELMH